MRTVSTSTTRMPRLPGQRRRRGTARLRRGAIISHSAMAEKTRAKADRRIQSSTVIGTELEHVRYRWYRDMRGKRIGWTPATAHRHRPKPAKITHSAAGRRRCRSSVPLIEVQWLPDHWGRLRERRFGVFTWAWKCLGMEVFVQQLINGITLGSIYGLIAIGYTM